jgi:hypothetical protein
MKNYVMLLFRKVSLIFLCILNSIKMTCMLNNRQASLSEDYCMETENVIPMEENECFDR